MNAITVLRCAGMLSIAAILSSCGSNDCWYAGPFGNYDSAKCPGGQEGKGRNEPLLAAITRGTSDEDWACGVCGTSEVVKNYSGTKVALTIVERRHRLLNKPGWEYTKDVDLELAPNERRYLGCTGSSEVGTNNCLISTSWMIKGRPRTVGQLSNGKRLPIFDRAEFLAAASVAQAYRVVNAPVAGSCERLCDARSPLCIGFKGRDGTVLRGISLTAESLATAKTEVPMEKVLAAFAVPDDPCGRSAISIGTDRTLQNTGAACELAASISDGSKNAIQVKVAIPDKLIGRLSHSELRTGVIFESESNSPVLIIDDPLLQSDWGGRLLSAAWDGKNATLQTTNGCVRLEGASESSGF